MRFLFSKKYYSLLTADLAGFESYNITIEVIVRRGFVIYGPHCCVQYFYDD